MAHADERAESAERTRSSDDEDSPMRAPEKSATGAFSRTSAGDTIAGAFLDEASDPLRRVSPFLALGLQAIVIVFLVVSIAVPIAIRNPGSMSVAANAAYILGTTLLASLIAAYTMGQIRILWLEDVLAVYADEPVRSDVGVHARTTEHRIQQARTLLGIGVWQDWFRFPSLTVCVAIMAAMAGAIVAGVAPSPLQSPLPSTGGMTTGADPSFGLCWNYTDSAEGQYLAMPTLNDSFLIPTYAHKGLGDSSCLTDRMLATLNVNELPPTYLYKISNALVNSSALGVPSNYIRTAGSTYFDDRARRADYAIPYDDLLSWSSCSPVVTSNPVKCKAAPNGTITRHDNGSVELSLGACNYTENSLYSIKGKGDGQGSTVGHVCPTGPGQATMLLGALDDATETLIFLMGDESVEWNASSYAIECSVDVWPSIGSREIEWSRLTDPSVAFYSPFVVAAKNNNTSETSCNTQWIWTSNEDPEAYLSGTPALHDLRTDGTLFAPLAALQVVFDENQGRDGHPETLYNMAGLTSHQYHERGRPNAPYTFAQSTTAIEDALGVVVAAALSLEWGNADLPAISGTPEAKAQKWIWFQGTWIQQGQRVGSGEWWTIAYLLPELFASIVIITFLIRSRQRRRVTSGVQRERRLRWLAGR